MAKKVVASLQSGEGRSFTKCIKMVKSPKSGAYVFEEEMVHNDHIKDFFGNSLLSNRYYHKAFLILRKLFF